MLEQLIELQETILTELATDLSAPFGTYSIDGQSVSRERWVKLKWEILGEIQELINQLDPYEIRTLAY